MSFLPRRPFYPRLSEDPRPCPPPLSRDTFRRATVLPVVLTTKCRMCGDTAECQFTGWPCSDPFCGPDSGACDCHECREKGGKHFHAMWMCGDCRQGRLDFT